MDHGDDRIDPDDSELEYEIAGVTSVEGVTRAYERDLLWCLVNGDQPDRMGVVAPIVGVEDFLNPLHGRLFRGLLEMHRRDRMVDAHGLLEMLTLRDHRNPVIPLVMDLWGPMAGGDPFLSRTEHYARRVRQRAVQRRLVEITRAEGDALRGRAVRLPTGEQIPALTPPDEVVALVAKAKREITRSAEAVSRARPIGAFRERAMSVDGSTVLTTGLVGLDMALRGGLRGGELTVLGARPAMGKTALALGMVAAMAGTGAPGLLFSLEMTGAELYRRLLARKAGISQHDWDPTSTSTWDRLESAADTIDELGIRLSDDSGVGLDGVRSEAERLHAEGRLRWVMVDYLGLMKQGDADRHDLAIAVNTKGLKELAKDFDVPVVLLAQLSRDLEKRPNKRPQPSDLRDSGSIEQDADVILFIYRDIVYNQSADPTAAEIIVGKQRNAPQSVVDVRWNGPLTRFEDADDGGLL